MDGRWPQSNPKGVISSLLGGTRRLRVGINEFGGNDSRWYPRHPMVAVHPIVFKGEQIVLIKRAKEPSKGKWSLPGGRIEIGETIYEAAKREILEECSIEINIERLFDIGESIIPDAEGRTSYHFVIIYLLARYNTGDIKAGLDEADIGWFTIPEATQLDMHPQLQSILESLS